MSFQRTRPTETLESIVLSFKQFEKKLDKLQDDVNYHGHTLSELHVLLANMAGGNFISKNDKFEEGKQLLNKTTAMHNNTGHERAIRTKRRSTLEPLKTKLAQKSSDFVKRYGNRLSNDLTNSHFTKLVSNAKNTLHGKRVPRQTKGDAPRKATTLRAKKDDKNKKKYMQAQSTYQFKSF